MKNIRTVLVMLLFVLILSLGLTGCMKEEDYYKKADVDALITELQTLLGEKTAASDTAIATLRGEYEAKIAVLEATDAEYKTALGALTADYEAKVEALEKADADNAAELAELQETYAADLAALQKADGDNKAAIDKLTAA